MQNSPVKTAILSFLKITGYESKTNFTLYRIAARQLFY
jgi:hypothetical protein